MKKILIFTLIVLGVLLMAYPLAKDFYVEQKQKELLEEWLEETEEVETAEAREEVEEDFACIEKQIEDAEKKDKPQFSQDEIKGLLEIEKISLKLPILKDSSRNGLRKSVVSVLKHTEVGENGNFVIAGHRSHTYGRNFNRLDELEVGDTLTITAKDVVYQYRIDEKLYVAPDETWVLKAKGGQEITLITCHPMINPTERLILKGHLEE